MNKTIDWTQFLLNSLIAITLVILAGCGGGGSSEGGAPNFDTGVEAGTSGVIVDPYIAEAVLVEESVDGSVLQESSKSDSKGRFLFSHPVRSDSTVKTKVGYQGIHNGEPFRGTLKTLVNGKKSFVLSPITTLMANGASGAEIITLLEQAGLSGLSERDLLQDPMAGIPELGFVIDEDLTLLRAAMSINAIFDLHNNYDMGINEISASSVRFADLVSVVEESVSVADFDQMVVENASLLASLGQTITLDYAVAASVKVTDSVVDNIQADPALDPLGEASALMVYAPELALQYFVKDNRGDAVVEQAVATGDLPDVQSDVIIEISESGEIISDSPGSFEFAVAAYEVGEGDGQVEVSINRFGGSDGAATLEWRTITFNGYGTADWANDYGTFLWQPITFADGETSKTQIVSINEDSLVEGDETFTLLLRGVGDAMLGSLTETVISIVDNDFAPELPPEPQPEPPPVDGELKVFPGAEGFGTDTPAGRGGQIIKVTNLNDSGPGSLRSAIAVSGPRIIVFEVGGIIDLFSNLDITSPFVTIAGQTAPSPGITLRGKTFKISTHDVLVQHLRVRVGDIRDDGTSIDGLTIRGSSVYNVVVDHISSSWALDENLGTWNAQHDVTISNSIFSEALVSPSYGMLIGDYSTNIAIVKNLMAHNYARNPLLKGGTSTVAVNNVMYNSSGTFMQTTDDSGAGPSYVSAVGNVFIDGPNTPVGVRGIKASGATPAGSLIYLEDNLRIGDGPLFSNSTSFDPLTATPPVWVDGIYIYPSSDTQDAVLLNVGARPSDRDAVDARIVDEVKNRSGYQIRSQSEVGGWPVQLESYRAFQLPVNPHGDDDGDGYTNIEEIIHAM